MNRSRTIGFATTVLSIFAFAGTSTRAQVSTERLHELMKQAADAAQQPLGFSAPQPVSTEPERVLQISLEDSVKFALDRNLDIRVQRLNPELQDIALASAKAFYTPSLTSVFNRSSSVGVPSSQLQLSSGGKGITQDRLVYNGGLSQNVKWGGGLLSATFNNNRGESDSNNSLFNPQYNSTWQAVYTQPLLRDFKIDAQRRTLQVTQVNREISDVQLKATITNLVSNVRNAYWDFVYATQAVEVAQQSLDLADKLVQDNQTRVEVGTMAPIDVVQARAEQATRRQGLVSAQNTRRTTELTLKRLIVSGTEDANWSATLNPVDRPEFQATNVDLEGAIRRALDGRTDVAIAKKNIENNGTTLKYLRNQSMPIVDATLTYGVNGIGGTQLVRQNNGTLGSGVTTTVPGGILDAFNTLFRNKYPSWTLGLNVTYPLGTSTQVAAVARARVQLNQVEAQIKQIELQVATEVTNAAINLRNAAESVQAAQAARELSTQRLEAEQSKFEVGMSTNYQVVQAQRDLNDARNSELRAILNHRKAQVEFDRLQETTLQNTNITVIGVGGGAGGVGGA
jgi:outer membrane protein TolC